MCAFMFPLAHTESRPGVLCPPRSGRSESEAPLPVCYTIYLNAHTAQTMQRGRVSGPACASFWRTCLLWVWFIYPASWRGGREEKSLCTLLAGAGERLLPTTPTPPAANARSA
jgi:hypothetical protein